jgi:glycosyltransferase involved in cell wall biosynthesis
MSLKVLFITNMWPDAVRPWHGPYVKRQADSLEAAGVGVDVLPIRGYASMAAYLAAAAKVAALNRRRAHDVVHAHYGHSGVVARLQFRAPLVVTYWGSDLLGKRTPSDSITLKSRLEAAVFRQLARVSAATITQSQQMQSRLPASCRERNRILPAGIELERFRPLPREEARRRLGWPPSERVVLFAGNPELAVKNYPLAEATHSRLAERLDDVRLRVAWGNPPDEMPLFMSAADVLLLPSRSEGSPNVVKEAMAAELPVVATPVGDVDELLRGVPGSHVRPPDPVALAEALSLALEHGRSPEAREAVAPLDIAAVARRTIEIYESVI